MGIIKILKMFNFANIPQEKEFGFDPCKVASISSSLKAGAMDFFAKQYASAYRHLFAAYKEMEDVEDRLTESEIQSLDEKLEIFSQRVVNVNYRLKNAGTQINLSEFDNAYDSLRRGLEENTSVQAYVTNS